MRLSRKVVFPCLTVFAALLGACSSPANQKFVRTYGMGDKVQVGQLTFRVFDSKWLTQIGTGVNARVPANRFFLVRLSVVNSGSQENNVPALSITDDTGQTYAELSNGEGVAQWMGYLRRAKPAETITGYIVFDAPPRHYKLNLSEELDDNKAVVDIPLTFSQEAPFEQELPVPNKPTDQVPPAPVRK